MGGRGSSFSTKEMIDGLLDGLNKRKNQSKSDTILIYGDVKTDFETSKRNRLTKDLKSSNILICQSMDKMNEDVKETNLQQIKNLTETYSHILGDNLTTEDLKIRCYDMNDKSLKTMKETPNYTVGALFEPRGGQICFNTRVVVSNEQLTKEGISNQRTNYSVHTDVGKEKEHIVTHEFGHFVENCIIENRLKKDVKLFSEYIKEKRDGRSYRSEEIRDVEASKITKEIMTLATEKYGVKNRRELRPSSYGMESNYEWFAEVFAETNRHTTDKPLVKAMKEFLKGESYNDVGNA